MARPLDAEPLTVLRSLGNPPTFEGSDAEYQDFPFSFRIHMSLVSPVWQSLMDKCKTERNPISLKAAHALGKEYTTCLRQMWCSFVLVTKGSVRAIVHSVQESFGADTWRLKHTRYAPDTHGRQYALMQKLGLRAWDLDFGERERASGALLSTQSSTQR